MQNNKRQNKYTVPCLLLPIIAKIKVIESARAHSDAGPRLNFSQFELQLIALKLSQWERLFYS